MDILNSYDDARRAEAYARLEFTGTYYLAFRDLPEILARNVRGKSALDFGCGAGRSTRFLRQLGFAAIGVDIAPDMLAQARAADPAGDYRRLGADGLAALPRAAFDLAFCAFPFDNIPTPGEKVALLRDLGERLAPEGRIVNLVSAPEIYVNEWASFSTRDYPENRAARDGDRVRIIITGIGDSRPVEDIVWSEAAYRDTYARAGLEIVEIARPLGRAGEPVAWVNETTIAPWNIHVVARRG